MLNYVHRPKLVTLCSGIGLLVYVHAHGVNQRSSSGSMYGQSKETSGFYTILVLKTAGKVFSLEAVWEYLKLPAAERAVRPRI